MSILTTSDFYGVTAYYRIPQGAGTSDSARLTGVIEEAEIQFCEKFGVTPGEITPGDKKEALKFFTFALWLRTQTQQKTPIGTGAKNNLKEATPMFDEERYVTSYNRACMLMGKPKKKLRKIFNY